LVPRDVCYYVREKANSLITDVARGVHVSIQTDATVTALEDAITESELGFRLAAVRAHLRRGIELIDHDDTTSSVLGFICELTSQFAPTSVKNHTSRRGVCAFLRFLDHVCHVKVFENHDLETFNQRRRELVQIEVSRPGDSPVQALSAQSNLRLVPRPLHTTLQLAIEPGKMSKLSVEVAWIRHVTAVIAEASNRYRQCGQVLHSEIDSY
jgi:hypothetical protein